MVSDEEVYLDHDLTAMYQEFIQEFNHVDGVFNILNEFMHLWEENIWESLFNLHCQWKNHMALHDYHKSSPENLLLAQAINNGILPNKGYDAYSDAYYSNSSLCTVDYDSFRYLYIFLEKLYTFYLGRELVVDDLWALHKSDISERILGGLDIFNLFRGNLFLGDEFFQEIKEVTWVENSLIFFKKFQNLFISFLFEDQGENETTYNLEIEKILVLLAHSGAVLSENKQIDFQCVLRAYQTLFKIIKTDITSLADKRYYTGLLLCGDCNELYPLLEDEAPFDFASCSCGGELKYVSMVESVTTDKTITTADKNI
jgi:hypothetical protein